MQKTMIVDNWLRMLDAIKGDGNLTQLVEKIVNAIDQHKIDEAVTIELSRKEIAQSALDTIEFICDEGIARAKSQ